MTHGLVLRVFGDRVLVRTAIDERTYRPKGRLRLTGILAGDRVQVEGEHIVEVEARRNVLGRPPVANVTTLLAVMAAAEPPPSEGGMDRLLLQAEAQELRALVVVNKCEVDPPAAARFTQAYAAAGYPVLIASARTGAGLDALSAALGEGLAVLAGPSGVGKSSLLHEITRVDVAVGAVSRRTGRGRHTTRAATVWPTSSGGLIADTPGFSELDLPQVEARALQGLYPEFRSLHCRFNDCRHRDEPDCAVRDACSAGRLDGGRYRRYLQFLEEIERRPPRWR